MQTAEFQETSAVTLDTALAEQFGEMDYETTIVKEHQILSWYIQKREWDCDPEGQREGKDDTDFGNWLIQHINSLRTLVHHAYGSNGDIELRTKLEAMASGVLDVMDVDEFDALLKRQADVVEKPKSPITVH